jgi:hypothetical protein
VWKSVQNLRDLVNQIAEHPGSCPDDLLDEINDLAARLKDVAHAERRDRILWDPSQLRIPRRF